MRTDVLVVGLFMCMISCTENPQQPLALQSCLPGWWMTHEVRCPTAQTCMNPQLACHWDDCTQVDILMISSDGSTLHGRFEWSRVAKHVTALEHPRPGRWLETAPNRIAFSLDDSSELTRCDAGMLLRGTQGYVRLFNRSIWDQAMMTGRWSW